MLLVIKQVTGLKERCVFFPQRKVKERICRCCLGGLHDMREDGHSAGFLPAVRFSPKPSDWGPSRGKFLSQGLDPSGCRKLEENTGDSR